MQLGIRALGRAGAGCVAIACNTAHHWASELAAESESPLLHIADAVCVELKRAAAYGDAVGILSTRGTLASGFYQRRLQGDVVGGGCLR